MTQATMLSERIVHRPHVDTARPDESVLAVAIRMLDRNVGTVVVVDEDRRPVGIVTDRDLVTRALARRRDAEDTAIADVMTRDPTTVTEHGAAQIALLLMRDGGFRRLPVVDQERRLVGILAVDDVVRTLAMDMVRVADVLDSQSPETQAES